MCLQTMSAGLHHFLLMVVSLSTVMAMPEPISEGSWEPPSSTLPAPPNPPVDGPGRFFSSDGDNMTEPPVELLEAYCQMLLQASDPVPQDQIPWFCLCTQCQSTPGPKGDRGDRGLPGEQQ